MNYNLWIYELYQDILPFNWDRQTEKAKTIYSMYSIYQNFVPGLPLTLIQLCGVGTDHAVTEIVILLE